MWAYSKRTGRFVAQLYVKSEEFDKAKDAAIADFNESDFGDEDLGRYIVKLLMGMDTADDEEIILRKNMNVVRFLSRHFDGRTNYTPAEWQEIYELTDEDIVDYAVAKGRFAFHKTIAGKARRGQAEAVINLIDKLSVGLASKDLPFGIIPAENRPDFAKELFLLYPAADETAIASIGAADRHLIVAIFKGFKPRGEDDRPDRELLPLISMISASDVDVMTYIYGSILEGNLTLLDKKPLELAGRNGLWRSILALSNYVALDAPVLAGRKYDVQRIYDTSRVKNHFARMGIGKSIRPAAIFSNVPVSYGEDDVDAGIHALFAHVLREYCFEGLCNPPGGDWSGLSIIEGSYENRWLSLPRVSDAIDGKRPDHVLEFFDVFQKPLILSVESKERSADFEEDVGTKLITYIRRLMDYVPSARRRYPRSGKWQWGDNKVSFEGFETISAAAYLGQYAEAPSDVFRKNCEILFVMAPVMTTPKSGMGD